MILKLYNISQALPIIKPISNKVSLLLSNSQANKAYFKVQLQVQFLTFLGYTSSQLFSCLAVDCSLNLGSS